VSPTRASAPAPLAAADRRWARTAPARGVRSLILRGVFGPLVAGYARVHVIGLPALAGQAGPVVFVANHSSHVDTPILLDALTPRRRRRTLMAAAADYFFVRRWLAVTVSLVFGAVPVRRHPGDGSSALDPLARLIGDGFSLVIYAEGTRSRDGHLGQLRSGAAALAARCGVPLVPVHIAGTADLMGPGHGWMVRPRSGDRRHDVTVRFGEPLQPRPGDDLAAVMGAVRAFYVASAGELVAPTPVGRMPASIA
jgi:1-acyl-sn-glycerol-3-phosphate acyltransferase